MSEFFEPPTPRPRSPRPPRRSTPPWVSAPRGILPGVLALELLLARNEKVAVCVTRLEGYPSGFALELVTMAAEEDDELDPMLFAGRRRFMHGRGAAETAIPEGMLRFGVEFADGSKATNTAGQSLAGPPGGGTSTSHLLGTASEAPQPPAGPVLNTGGGGGGGGSWRQNIWIWPLPPTGRLAFVCEWPAAGIELTRHEIDAQLILDAAGRAQSIFPDEPPAEQPQPA